MCYYNERIKDSQMNVLFIDTPENETYFREENLRLHYNTNLELIYMTHIDTGIAWVCAHFTHTTL